MDATRAPSPPLAQPSRHDTESTTSSRGHTPTPIPPGFYTLPVHGNCPRCHHHHKAATINVRISKDYSRVSHVYCEKCKEKWLAIGGGNSTRISLLSTQTTEPDLVENDFRSALIDMVRSVTSIASPAALASVPEQPSGGPSGGPSRDHSVRSHKDDIHESARPESPGIASGLTEHGQGTSTVHAKKSITDSERKEEGTSSDTRRAKNILLRLKDRILVLKKLQLRQLMRSKKKEVKMTWRGRGKLPVVKVEETDSKATTSEVPKLEQTREATHGDAKTTIEDDKQPKPEVTTTSPTVPPTSNVDKDVLKGMTKEQRIAWIREQFSDFKCRCPRNCYCRGALSSATPSQTGGIGTPGPPPPPSPRVAPERSLERSHSHDLLLIGSHLNHFQTGEFFPGPRRFSIGSTTRLSQAATMVNSDTLTATSGAPFLDLPRPQRPRSRSPAGPSRLRQSTGPDDVENRPSQDIFPMGGAVMPIDGTDGRLVFYATPHTPSPVSPPTPMNRANSTPSIASTPRLNGHGTFEQRDGTSSQASTH